jgi:PAS domain S-box-containing protein
MDYRKILDAIPQLIYVTTPDGVTSTFYNKMWYDYTGLDEKVLESGWSAVIDPHDIERVIEIVEKAVANKEPYTVEVRLKCCKGMYRWFLAKATPIFDEAGNLEAYVGVSSDIDYIKTSIRDMEAVYDKAAEERLAKIAELEKELQIHRTQN